MNSIDVEKRRLVQWAAAPPSPVRLRLCGTCDDDGSSSFRPGGSCNVRGSFVTDWCDDGSVCSTPAGLANFGWYDDALLFRFVRLSTAFLSVPTYDRGLPENFLSPQCVFFFNCLHYTFCLLSDRVVCLFDGSTPACVSVLPHHNIYSTRLLRFKKRFLPRVSFSL